MFMSHLLLHVLGVDIDLWVCSNELLSNLLNNLLNSFWVHTYELQNVSSGLLPFWRLHFVLNIPMSFNILNLMKVVYLFPSKTTWSISMRNHLFWQTRWFFLWSPKEYLFASSSSLHVIDDFKYSCLSMK